MASDWTVDSWKSKPDAQGIAYSDPAALAAVHRRMSDLPPLVTSWEVERLKGLIGDAQEGKRFWLQGGDCAETLADCRPGILTNKLKILLQMSLVLIHGTHKPVIRVGRFAGQYAKPRSSPTEKRDGVELPSYFGDLINRPEFTAEARKADPALLLRGYEHAALTLNFIRSLSAGGFADVHHPEYWDLEFFQKGRLPQTLRAAYEKMTTEVAEAMRFMEVLGEHTIEDLTRVDFFTSHEALNLHYESAITRTVPRRDGHYDLSTHFPWIGERTRALDGAHVEFFRGVRNALGIKVGPKATPAELLGLLDALNPDNERGKIVLIVRMGAKNIRTALPPLLRSVKARGDKVLWVSDPMHGNTHATATGIKTRDFDDILNELDGAVTAHREAGTFLGGVHFELTGEDVTECTGGAGGLTDSDLDKRYASLCDPRLNYRQALEMSFHLGQLIAKQRTVTG